MQYYLEEGNVSPLYKAVLQRNQKDKFLCSKISQLGKDANTVLGNTLSHVSL